MVLQAAVLLCMHTLPAALPSVACIPCYYISGRHNGVTWSTKHTLLSKVVGFTGAAALLGGLLLPLSTALLSSRSCVSHLNQKSCLLLVCTQ